MPRQHAGADDARTCGITSFSVRVVDDWRELKPLESSWDDLAGNALEPSPSAEHWMLIPALRYGLPGENVRVMLVFGSIAGSPERPPVLCAVFPIEVQTRYRGLPARVVRLWNHIYSLVPAPLLRKDCAAECLRVFFDWIRAERYALVDLPALRGDSAFFRLLTEILREGGLTSLIADIHTRAIFRPKANAEQYILSVSGNYDRRRRQERRLLEKGTLAYGVLDASQNVDTWVDEFIALEKRGWKGKEGTAFGCNEDHCAWLKEVAHTAAERGRLMMLALRLDGRPIALRLSFLALPGSYAFKVAFDEDLAKFSPGVLLELENIRRLHSMPELEWMDSLAAPGSALIDRLWEDRAAIASVLVAPGRVLGKVLVSALPLLRTLKQLLRRAPAKD